MNKTVKYITATEHDSGQRIDNYLFKKFKNVPKSYLYRIIRKGELRINKKRVKADYKLKINDMIRIPPLRVDDTPTKKKIPTHRKAIITNSILFENEDLLIINKPAGIAVHSGSGDDFGIIEIIREVFPYQPYLELVHRIDKETSGCLMIAKRRTVLLKLHELIKAGSILKKYQLMCHGHWPKALEKVQLDVSGKSAQTSFLLKKHYKNISLVEATLHTGRMHQIRIHASQSGYPIVGDNKYGNFKKDKALLKHNNLKHMYLHAASLAFDLDLGSNKHYEFEAPLPDYFTRILREQ